jgi:hypothetical protein
MDVFYSLYILSIFCSLILFRADCNKKQDIKTIKDKIVYYNTILFLSLVPIVNSIVFIILFVIWFENYQDYIEHRKKRLF